MDGLIPKAIWPELVSTATYRVQPTPCRIVLKNPVVLEKHRVSYISNWPQRLANADSHFLMFCFFTILFKIGNMCAKTTGCYRLGYGGDQNCRVYIPKKTHAMVSWDDIFI